MQSLWPLPIVVHTAAAVAALGIGIAQFARAKGSAQHRALGWTWVALMGTVALTSIFIHDTKLPGFAGFGPIHLLTVLSAVTLPLLVLRARQHRVAAHRRIAILLFGGALVVAGVLTLLPGRRLGQLFWGALGLAG